LEEVRLGCGGEGISRDLRTGIDANFKVGEIDRESESESESKGVEHRAEYYNTTSVGLRE